MAKTRAGAGTALGKDLQLLCTVSGATSSEMPQEAGKERFELEPAD